MRVFAGLAAPLAGLLAVAAAAQNVAAPATGPAPGQPSDPAAQMRADAARLRQAQPRPAAAPSFASERAAAVAFVELARDTAVFPDQRLEHCAFILRGADKRYRLGSVQSGDMDKCPSETPQPSGAVASAHTHPLGGRDDDVSAAAQVFSDSDFAFAEWPGGPMPIYLGAPAGHILRYAPGGTTCIGSSFVIRNFEIVKDLAVSVDGRLPINPGQKIALFTIGGQPIPKPPYCRAP
jgi:hypothetical protein